MTHDPEIIFSRLAAGDWPGALDAVRRAPALWTVDHPVAGRAAELLVRRLDLAIAEADAGAEAATGGAGTLDDADLELAILLGRAGRLPIARDVEARMIEALLAKLTGDPARALAIARFRPDLPACAAVVAQFGFPERERGRAAEVPMQTAGLDHGTVEAARSIFRSPREFAFHRAASRVFAGLLVCPNVALHAALDFERLRARLSAVERRLFFGALVDCVVFDPASGYRPAWFFELDSPVHDDAKRAEKDAMKDRIVALAGHRLIRLRAEGRADDEFAYERALQAIVGASD